MDRKLTNSSLQFIEQQLKQVVESIHEICRFKDASISSLEDFKRQIRKESDPYSKKSFDEGSRDSQGKTDFTQREKKSVEKLDENIFQMERDISSIQYEHDQAISHLETRKSILQGHLSSIEKLDLLINVLTYKIYEAQHDYRKDIDRLYREREEIAKRADLNETQKAIALTELEKRMEEKESVHKATISSLEGQKMELRRESQHKMKMLDLSVHDLKIKHQSILDQIEVQKHYASPSQLALLHEKETMLRTNFMNDIKNFEDLQVKGWKGWMDSTSEEKLAEKLQERGLQITKSGHLLTSSGEKLTVDDALTLGLLKGVEELAQRIQETQKFATEDGEKSTPSQVSQTTSTESIYSNMTSADVQYVKEKLGKPLVLAMAEITAKQPRDPIHYLAHWLMKYRYNQEVDQTEAEEITALMEERQRIAQEKWKKFLNDEAREAILDMIANAESIALRRQMERELRRIAEEEMRAEEEMEIEDYLPAIEMPFIVKKETFYGRGRGASVEEYQEESPLQTSETDTQNF